MTRITRSAPVLGLLALTACGGSWSGTPEPTGDGIGINGVAGGTVVSAHELGQGGGSILDALQGKIPNFKIDLGTYRCPSITLRSAKDFRGDNFPQVYVDGTRAQNTCILQSMAARDTERVEVYPAGFTTRPGYGTSIHGLILVFTRR